MKCRVMLQRNEPNSAQRKALKNMVNTEFDDLLAKYNREVKLVFAYWLYSYLGYRQNGLEKAIKSIGEHLDHLDSFELDGEHEFICETLLKSGGIDIERMLNDEDTQSV